MHCGLSAPCLAELIACTESPNCEGGRERGGGGVGSDTALHDSASQTQRGTPVSNDCGRARRSENPKERTVEEPDRPCSRGVWDVNRRRDFWMRQPMCRSKLGHNALP